MRKTHNVVYFMFGQSLIEVVVSVGIAVVLAVSLISTTLVTQKTARSAKNNTQASKLVQQSIEQLRVLRDRKGYAVLGNGLCYKLDSSNADPVNWSLSSVGCPETIALNNVNFSRTIKIEDGALINTKLVTVTVTWDDSGGTQTVSGRTILSLWDTL